MTGEIEPLDPHLWFERIEMISNGELQQIENALRHAGHLAQLAPIAFRTHVGLSIAEAEFEALLESGDFDAAARCLQPGVSYLEPQAQGLRVSVAIKSLLLERTFEGRGETLASAILSAWTASLLALRSAYRPN